MQNVIRDVLTFVVGILTSILILIMCSLITWAIHLSLFGG